MVMIIKADLVFCVLLHTASQLQSYGVTVPSSGGCRSLCLWGGFSPDFRSMFFSFFVDSQAEQAPEFSHARSDRKGLQDI